MYVVRDVFQCKPGKAKDIVEKFRKAFDSMKNDDGFRSPRILVDAVAGYWTVVLETEVDSLAQFELHMQSYASQPEVRAAMDGYMDLVNGGHREIFRIA